ncbi:uncharacterized protein ARMOST_18819 [Armillaria ostoyae]|uniref:Uncharacterized protein n=1 Tax=Armillaria ostoyae TaxID=47428 RepID=A0A284S2W1_ARMOS|nr:uncharacterized protein ARMOST_18819 [Armillaria ostoyae]
MCIYSIFDRSKIGIKIFELCMLSLDSHYVHRIARVSGFPWDPFALYKFYVNSSLAMLNYRPILRITPHSLEGSTEEANIGIPLTEIQDASSLDDKLNYSKGIFDC